MSAYTVLDIEKLSSPDISFAATRLWQRSKADHVSDVRKVVDAFISPRMVGVETIVMDFNRYSVAVNPKLHEVRQSMGLIERQPDIIARFERGKNSAPTYLVEDLRENLTPLNEVAALAREMDRTWNVREAARSVMARAYDRQNGKTFVPIEEAPPDTTGALKEACIEFVRADREFKPAAIAVLDKIVALDPGMNERAATLRMTLENV